MKRPLAYAAGGFVLGEVWLLLPVELKAVIPVLVLAGVLLLWRSRGRSGYVERSGRSLMNWCLPLFCFALLGAALLRADTRRAEDCADRIRAVEGVTLKLEGLLKDARPGKEGSYAAVLELSDVTLDVRGEISDFGGSVLVYLEEAPRGLGAADAGSSAGQSPEQAAAGSGASQSPEQAAAEAPADEMRIGMRVSVRGELESMGQATNPGEFDYGKYYHALGIEGRMFGKDLRPAGDEYSPYLDGVWRFKRYAEEILARLCGGDSRDLGVFTAVALGDKTALASDVRELYQRNGIAHLLAVSGLHVSLIGMGCYRLLRKRLGLGFELSGALAAAVTVTYGVMTGGSASVVRAVVMVCLQFLADKLGRTYDMLSAMAAAAVLLLIQSPALLFQAGFQLSFGAILAIGAVYPVFEEWTGVGRGGSGREESEHGGVGRGGNGRGKSGRGGSALGRTVLLGLVIQIVTLPVTVYHFYEYPIYGTVLNLLVIPLMGYVLISALAGVVCGAVWLPAGRFAIGTGHYILMFYEWLCRRFEQLPGAVQIVGRPQLWQLALYGAGWCALLMLAAARSVEEEKKDAEQNNSEAPLADGGGTAHPQPHMGVRPQPRPGAHPQPHMGVRSQPRPGAHPQPHFGARPLPRLSACPQLRLAFLALCACAGYMLLQAVPVSGLRAVFLDVGQGDGICLESRETVILIDGGSTSREDVGEQVLEPYLKSRGIRRIDCAVVSHGDEDHISGIRYLLESDCGIKIDTLVLPRLAAGDEKYAGLERLAGRAGTDIVWMKAGDVIAAAAPEAKEAGAGEPAAAPEAKDSGGARLRVKCLYAGDPAYREDTNDHSLLLEAVYGSAGILLTGDMSAEGEARWLSAVRAGEAEDISGPVQVLKVAHHGSDYSSGADFLDHVRPDWGIISCGRNNRYGHPGEETTARLEERGIDIFLTMELGAVTVTTDGKAIKAAGTTGPPNDTD